MITNYEKFITIIIIIVFIIVGYLVSYTIINAYKNSKGIKKISIETIIKRTKQRINKINNRKR